MLPSGRQAYEFIPVNDQYAVVTANGDFYRIDLNTFEAIRISTGSTWGGCGSGIVYQDKLLLNVKGQKIYKIDIKTLCGDLSQYDWKNQFPYENIDVSTSGGTRFVECKDGNLYTVESTNGENNLVKIKPDFTIEKLRYMRVMSPPLSVPTEKRLSAEPQTAHSTISQEEKSTGQRLTILLLQKRSPLTPKTVMDFMVQVSV